MYNIVYYIDSWKNKDKSRTGQKTGTPRPAPKRSRKFVTIQRNADPRAENPSNVFFFEKPSRARFHDIRGVGSAVFY